MLFCRQAKRKVWRPPEQVPIPYVPVLESAVFPDRNRIIAGIREVLDARFVGNG